MPLRDMSLRDLPSRDDPARVDFVSRLSVVAAYASVAFVGAIVLGMI